MARLCKEGLILSITTECKAIIQIDYSKFANFLSAHSFKPEYNNHGYSLLIITCELHSYLNFFSTF